ncbi:hypothetical protein ACHAW5_003021 [Stephanodiscus triporus]|uniref:4'-phosphopantetheinyl transferase domain-containing protein n=1 Tax=Stephanodiscus triporus TaxID=2934178 RepID=A0ABD3N0Y2_9STRA
MKDFSPLLLNALFHCSGYGTRLMMIASKQHTSRLNFARNALRPIPSNHLSNPNFSALSKIGTEKSSAVMWMYGPSYCCHRRINRHNKNIYRITSTPDPRDQMKHRPCCSPRSFSVLFTQHDSKSIQSAQNQHLDARHWFTQLLPEGWCVGVRTGHAAVSAESGIHEEESSLSSIDSLHPDEYHWGRDHIASDASRTSYYLGRMALRSSLGALLDSEKEKIDPRKERGDFYIKLHDQIQTTAINKDYYGRPVLPEIISGSISHKGEYAVGLARFRSHTWNAQNRPLDNGLTALDASSVSWREECTILDQDEEKGLDDGDGVSCLSSPLTVRGIGIDLERIDARRGRRIERKVLTENEQLELGGLEGMGVSSAEEVMLRFSLKESVYKAMHPVLCQYVGFQEAEITPLSDGTAKVTLNLINGSHLGIVVQSASWRKMGDFFITSASVGAVPR